jgi:HEAT repeat protein
MARFICGSLVLVAILLVPLGPLSAEERPIPKGLLESGDWEERVKGLKQLAPRKDDEKAAEAAIELLNDVDWEVRIEAARALGAIGTKGAIEALLDTAVKGEIAWLRDAAVEALASHDHTDSAPRLLKRVRSYREEKQRVAALEAFGHIAPVELVSDLRTWTRHKDVKVAAAAVRAVATIAARAPTAAEPILKLLEHPLDRRAKHKHFFAYMAAIDALGALNDSRARVLLIEELLRIPKDDPYVPLRIARHVARMDPMKVRSAVNDALPLAEEAIQRRRLARLVGEARIVPLAPLVASLLRKSKDDLLSAEAVRTLGILEDDDVVSDVERALEHEAGRVRIEAVGALARLLPIEKVLLLEETIRADKHWPVRRQYVVALNDLDDPVAIPVLGGFVEDKDWRVATAAIVAIGTLGVAADLPRLEPLTSSKEWKVRAAAYEAMGRLRAPKAIPRLTFGLEDKDPVVRGVCHANLQILTREKLGEDPKVWRKWWEKHGEGLKLKKRSRMTAEEKEKEEAERSRTRYAHEKYEFERDRGVEILQKARILVVSGAWDHVEIVLRHLDIPHTALRGQHLKSAGLNPNQVVLVNCEGNLDRDSQDRLRWFVNVGGYCMTTDWALTKTVNLCFPGYLAQYPGSTTGNDVVVVQEARPGHPFTRGVFTNVPALMWWLEIQALPFVISYPEQCDVLVDSAEMMQRYGSSPMACAFRWGLGKVQHSVSHFYLQEEGMQKASKPRDRMIFAADNLGLSLAQIRKLRTTGAFEGKLNEETMREIAPDYSMFRMIVNVVKEKSDWVENL